MRTAGCWSVRDDHCDDSERPVYDVQHSVVGQWPLVYRGADATEIRASNCARCPHRRYAAAAGFELRSIAGSELGCGCQTGAGKEGRWSLGFRCARRAMKLIGITPNGTSAGRGTRCMTRARWRLATQRWAGDPIGGLRLGEPIRTTGGDAEPPFPAPVLNGCVRRCWDRRDAEASTGWCAAMLLL